MDRYTKKGIRSNFSYARHVMRLIDAELRKPTTLETLTELENLLNEATAAIGSDLSYYIEQERADILGEGVNE